MKAEYRLANADNLDATLTVTMRVSEWKELADQLPARWPSWKIARAISEMVVAANKRFDAATPIEDK